MPYINQNGKRVWVEPAEFDDDPLLRVDVREDGTLDHSVAFDPRYECECDRIDGRHGVTECTPGALSAN
jgi:hypothetical protein